MRVAGYNLKLTKQIDPNGPVGEQIRSRRGEKTEEPAQAREAPRQRERPWGKGKSLEDVVETSAGKKRLYEVMTLFLIAAAIIAIILMSPPVSAVP